MGDIIKGLEHYVDFPKFCLGKRFLLNATRPWVDFNTKQHLGTVAEVVIVEDKIPYRIGPDGTEYHNRFAKLDWKLDKDLNVPIGSYVVPVDATVILWAKEKGGEKNNMSIRVKDIRLAPAAASTAPAAPTPTGTGKALYQH